MRQTTFQAISLTSLLILAFGSGLNRYDLSGFAELAPAVNPLALLSTVEVGGMPDSIVVDHTPTRNDVAFYDLSNSKLRYLDGDSLTMTSDEIHLPSWGFNSWMQYDRHFNRIYVVTTATQTGWYEASVKVIEDRTLLTTLSINDEWNEGEPDPPDDKYAVEGFTLEQPNTEGSNPARLIVDNTYTGKVDFVDLEAAGTGVVRRQRAAYRAPLTGPTWKSDNGNSLALETNHETLASDDLTTKDILYISDPNHDYVGGYGYVRVMRIGQPSQNLNATLLPEINLNATWPFANGLKELEMAGERDFLYIASGLQSFNNGYMGRLKTTTNAFNAINLTYGDIGFLHVDWFDTNRVFITTFDYFYNDPSQGLYLHLVYDQTVVDSLKLMDDYDEGLANGIRNLTYDPYSRRLYLTIGAKIMVVAVNYGSSPFPFELDKRVYMPLIHK